MKQQLTPSGSRTLSRCRQMVETAISHLCHGFEIERVWARDLWHLTRRIARKLLAHTVMVFLNLTHGRPPLQFVGLIRD